MIPSCEKTPPDRKYDVLSDPPLTLMFVLYIGAWRNKRSCQSVPFTFLNESTCCCEKYGASPSFTACSLYRDTYWCGVSSFIFLVIDCTLYPISSLTFVG